MQECPRSVLLSSPTRQLQPPFHVDEACDDRRQGGAARAFPGAYRRRGWAVGVGGRRLP